LRVREKWPIGSRLSEPPKRNCVKEAVVQERRGKDRQEVAGAQTVDSHQAAGSAPLNLTRDSDPPDRPIRLHPSKRPREVLISGRPRTIDRIFLSLRRIDRYLEATLPSVPPQPQKSRRIAPGLRENRSIEVPRRLLGR
jgi:hypothetical protein